MAMTFLFHCPFTGYRVQGHAEAATADEDETAYHLVTCAACSRPHLVNPKTGRVAAGPEHKRPK